MASPVPDPIDTSVYVHFPWCAKKCPYCDFATRAVEPQTIPHEAYADALLRDLEARRESLRGRRLFSVFFGGGTPSLWSAAALRRTLEGIRGAFASEVVDLEITAECNPSSLSEEQAAAFREAGIGRMSIGVQSLREPHLKFLGRLHDADGARRAIRGARATGVAVSADLMFGMRDQRDILADVDALIAEGLDHVSAYALTIEPGTQFGTLARMGKLEVADEDDYARMFLEAEARFAVAGLALRLAMQENRCVLARIAVMGGGATALRMPDAEAILEGSAVDDAAIAAAVKALRAAVDPPQDVHADADYRRHALGVLLERALRQEAA